MQPFSLHRQPIHKKQTSFRLQDEKFPIHETMQSFSPHLSHGRRVFDSSDTIRNQNEEDHSEHEDEVDSLQTETNTIDHQQEENIGSASHGTSVTRKESQALSETRKSRLNKEKLVFVVDDCAGRIIGEDSQQFITNGGCVMGEHAKLDGTTWKNKPALLKKDIISKCTENLNFDPNAIQTQLANQHKNMQYRLHRRYNTFPTKEMSIMV